MVAFDSEARQRKTMGTNPPNESLRLVFVYGTLKRGHQRNHVLADQTFIRPAVTVADYRMYNLGDYPGLIELEPGSGDQIQGEIYQVNHTCLRQLDQIEAVDQGLYERREIRLASPLQTLGSPPKLLDGPIAAYFYLGNIDGYTDYSTSW